MKAGDKLITDSLAKALYRWIMIIVYAVSAVIFIIGNVQSNNNFLLSALFFLFVGNLLYGFEKILSRFIFLIFNFACMFFLFGRNFVEFVSGKDWQAGFIFNTNKTVCIIIYVSMISIAFGAFLAERFKARKIKTKEIKIPKVKPQISLYKQETFIKNLRIISFWLYIFCYMFLIVTELEKLILMRGKGYAEYYLDYQSTLPGFFFSIGALAKFCICAYLITNPPKFQAVLVLGTYIVSTVPVFIIGKRNPFLSAVMFSICYYFLRDSNLKPKEKRWFGKFEITAIIIALPFVFAFLSIYESIRLGITVNKVNIGQSILNLFHTQGVTYDVMAKGVDNIGNLPPTNINYTFGPIIEYFRTNSITKILFGTVSYDNCSVQMAYFGNSFGDTISYLDLGDAYFTGAGLGSAFMIENFVDFGLVGVSLFSLLLGFVFIKAVDLYKKSVVWKYFVLMMLLQIFMLPRSSATGWIVPLLYFPMYILMIGLVVLTGLTIKNYYKVKE